VRSRTSEARGGTLLLAALQMAHNVILFYGSRLHKVLDEYLETRQKLMELLVELRSSVQKINVHVITIEPFINLSEEFKD
jgi:polyhydroxyalkanoate synthesis regulator protein